MQSVIHGVVMLEIDACFTSLFVLKVGLLFSDLLMKFAMNFIFV